ncbi:hypothetical protein WN944_012005 [Citrus x changshan-huyou]|uniref:Peptidase metallopeptidase domain-containing protein n=1 Tax=Citrus x changshan-huyou TaxID=2935761 RepID=A0AAP0MUF5_9ROSI
MKTFSLHAFMSLFLLQLLLMHALASDASNNKRKPSALEFFEQFRGSQKGDKVKGIHQLRKYLQSLGYVNQNNIRPSISLDNSDNESHIEDDYFGEDLESAIKTYQINFNLNATGTLDLQTISTMAQPRCGLPDIINGTTRMQRGSADKKYDIHYAFFEGPRWPLTKKTVTYAFQPGTRDDIHEPVRVALLLWSNWAPFTFEGSNDYQNADIKISFQRGDHGDGTPFDGPWHTLGHAFSDPYAVVHFNGDVNWVMGTVKGGFDMQTVALHELGHVLGLSHSSVKAASMWPSTRAGTTKGLNDDDIRRMKMLYGRQ